MQCGSGHGTGGLGNRPVKCSWTTGEEQTPKCKLAVQVAAWLGGGNRRVGDAVAGGGWCGWLKERFEEIGRGKKGAREVRGCGKQKRKRGVVIIPRLASESGVPPSLPPSLPFSFSPFSFSPFSFSPLSSSAARPPCSPRGPLCWSVRASF